MDYTLAGNVLEDLLNDITNVTYPNIRPIHNLQELREVYKLTHNCYVTSGYTSAHASRIVVHYPIFDHIEQTTILVAVLHGKIVGSVSLTYDGPLHGFSVDEDFKDSCEAIRAEGKSVATVWRLVVDDSVRGNRSVLMSLVNEVVHRLRWNGVLTALFAVNPKHQKVYQRLLNMEVVAQKLETGGLSNAPAILLRADADKIPEHRDPMKQKLVYNPIHALITSGDYY